MRVLPFEQTAAKDRSSPRQAKSVAFADGPLPTFRVEVGAAVRLTKPAVRASRSIITALMTAVRDKPGFCKAAREVPLQSGAAGNPMRNTRTSRRTSACTSARGRRGSAQMGSSSMIPITIFPIRRHAPSMEK